MHPEKINRLFMRLAGVALVLTFCVIEFGAYVRLNDAGLGCPDWPDCYGQLVGVPQDAAAIQRAETAYPGRPVKVGKAWLEVLHRYLAGALGLLLLAMAALACVNRRNPQQRVWLPLGLALLTVFQALLGMWTVTLLLQPAVVVAHLVGGFAVLGLLWWLNLDRWMPGAGVSPAPQSVRGGGRDSALFAGVAAGIVLLLAQIVLGGWTSANYAALACPDFPLCQGRWLPAADFAGAFQLDAAPGANYEYGVLDHPARTAIHLAHRGGALVVTIYLAVLFIVLLAANAPPRVKRIALAAAWLLAVQVSLGISNVLLGLPMAVAVAHNGVAAMLLLSLLALLRVLKFSSPKPLLSAK